ALHPSDSNTINLGDRNPRKIESLTYENREMVRYAVDELRFYTTKIDGKTFMSSSQLLLENTIRVQGRNQVAPILEKLYTTASISKSASLFLYHEAPSSLQDLRTSDKKGIPHFADWIALDFTPSPKDLLLTGVTITGDSTNSFTKLFKENAPLSNRTVPMAPQNAASVLSFSFADPTVFARNQKTYIDSWTALDEKLDNIEEVGIVMVNGKKVVFLHVLQNETFSEALEALKLTQSEYQGSELSKLSEPKFVEDLFPALLEDFDANFHVLIDNTHVFAAEKTLLHTVLTNKKRESTFEKGAVFTALAPKLSNESSLLFLSGNEGASNQLSTYLTPDQQEKWNFDNLKNHAFALQLVADQDFSHLNVLVAEITKAQPANAINSLFTLALDAPLLTEPQFVKNHRTNAYEIVVQDQNHFLYLISTEGAVLWKKELVGEIQGKIHQVDLYKNGKLQLAFCTNNQFLVLDRNGEIVTPFQKTFDGGNLNPLAVFDYENNRNYRFLITQGRKIFMYDNRATIVSGFTYKEAESNVLDAPSHFRVNGKDYIVLTLENGSLKIRHRAGHDRIPVDRTIDFSGNGVFLYKNKFSVTDKKGVLHQVDTKGKLSATNFNLSPDHGMFATSKSLALMDGNELTIKGKKVTLDLGVYTQPQIFYLYDKIYVAVTDVQHQKVYLFDSQAIPIPNFPVNGASNIDLIDMNRNGKLELVVKDQENSIVVHRIN
ncbi:MAG: ribonuclease HII, partial [Bacteroidota bacterium]